ncbi:class I SAM-dependent methyltransferase [Planctomycetota bacterium]|nr:class I SAM-dependent methyltransferase [Planctomycetota bacterium]
MDHFATTRQFYLETVKPVVRYSRRPRLDILLDYVGDKNVLDLGCVEHEADVEAKQDWWLHGLIKQRAKSLKGIDLDPVAVEALKAKGYDISVENVESMDLGQKYDVVVAGELLEHLTNHRSFLEGVRRHLTPDGLLVASVPNANSLNYFIQTAVFGHEVDAWDHSAFFTPVTISVMLAKCGFQATEIVLYQPSEIFHHESRVHRGSAFVFNKVQQAACWLRPSLARGLVVVAKSAVS